MPIKVWDGRPLDYHMCLLHRVSVDDFKGKCCECSKDIFYKDLSVAKKYICVLCMEKFLFNKE